MKVLVLRNNNIPDVKIERICGEESCDIKHEELCPSVDDHDYDVFVSETLSLFFRETCYDCIILPYSFSLDNYLEYTGLRVAMHIRLTPEWKHKYCPILFVGPDDEKHVAKFSEFGGLLATSGIFKTQKTKSEEIKDILCWIKKNCRGISESQYKNFLRKMRIQPPQRFDSHHSVANIWAIKRSCELFKIPEASPVKELKHQLFFKKLEADYGMHDKIGKKTKNPIINNIENSVILYIDDEYNKGWKKIFQTLCGGSKSELRCFNGFNPSLSKSDLISSITDWIDAQEKSFDSKSVPLYIIDLRLHDDDNKQEYNKPKDNESVLSGIDILKYIKKKNKGNQVVVFTASNKTWNMQSAMLDHHANAYIIKESPEHSVSADDTSFLFNRFSQALQKCYKNGYMRDYVSKVADIKKSGFSNEDINAGLDSFIDAMVLDNDSLVNNMCFLLLGVIESFFRTNFELEIESGIVKCHRRSDLSTQRIFQFLLDKNRKTTTTAATFAFPKICKENELDSKESIPNKLVFYDKLTNEKDINKSAYSLPSASDIDSVTTMAIAGLKHIYKFSDDSMNMYWEIKKLRNGYAHGSISSNYRSLSMKDVHFLFNTIISRLFAE